MKKRQLKSNKNRQIKIAYSCYSGSSERCGDCCSWANLFNGLFAAVLSDGMGKGEVAARESKKAVNAVIALLKADMDPEMALQVLNLLWSMSNRKEMFPTMDLALLDPENRELIIYKIGAAPTVIVRAPRCRPERLEIGRPGQNGAGLQDSAATATCRSKRRRFAAGPVPPEQIEILTAPAMPMGVSEYSEIPSISTIVMPGDLIIMMTDGIVDSKRDDPELAWLRRLLSRIKSRNLQTVCDLIIREAALNYGSHEKDDMTVVAISV